MTHASVAYPEGQHLLVDQVGGPQRGVDQPDGARRPWAGAGRRGWKRLEGLGAGDTAGWQEGTAIR